MAGILTKWDPHTEWVFPQETLTEHEEEKVIGKVTEIALKPLFRNFRYFGGSHFQQDVQMDLGEIMTLGPSTKCLVMLMMEGREAQCDSWILYCG